MVYNVVKKKTGLVCYSTVNSSRQNRGRGGGLGCCWNGLNCIQNPKPYLPSLSKKIWNLQADRPMTRGLITGGGS